MGTKTLAQSLGKDYIRNLIMNSLKKKLKAHKTKKNTIILMNQAMKYLLKSILLFIAILSSINLFSQEVFDSSIVKFQEVIYFDSGKHELIDSNFLKLNTLIDKANQTGGLQFIIDAHTDDIASNAFNLELSKKRKQSVYNYLIQSGVEDKLITSHFHGENQLAIRKKDPLSRQINRRVVVQAFTTDKYLNLTGQIIDEDTKEGIPGIVEIQASNFSSIVETNNVGQYKIAAPLNEIVTIDYYAQNHYFDSKLIRVTKSMTGKKISLKKASLGSKLVLKNINFVGNKNTLLPSSQPKLNKLLKFMTINTKVCIELAGHINSYGKSYSPKHDLSIARSLIIYEELKYSGIKEERMISRGYGDSFKLYPEPKSDNEREANMRVEIIIVNCDTVSQSSNDTLIDARYYSNIMKYRKFNIYTFQNDIKYFYYKNQSEIMFKVKNLKDNGEDPSPYTYAELMKDGQDLKYKDNQVAIRLRQIYTKDQIFRNQTKEIEKTYGLQSQELKDLWIKIKNTDALNLIEVKKILDDRGWLGPEEVSDEGNAALFLVIQHADLKTQLDYLTMMQEAVKKGNAEGHDLALLEDRVALRQGKKQIYGSQIYKNLETGIPYVAPLDNPQNVNLKREAIGLEPIEEYVKNWDIDWKSELSRMKNND